MRRTKPFLLAAILLIAISCGPMGAGPAPEPLPAKVSRSPAPDPRPSPAAPTAQVSSPVVPSPRFVGSVRRVRPAMRRALVGRNWHPWCPIALQELRHVEVSYHDFHGHVRTGPLIVHREVGEDILWVFRRLFRARFPIHRIDLPPRYRPPRPEDRLSTRNLTSSFNCRPATDSPGSLSHHSYGWAIDINPLQNPYVRSDGSVLRRAVRPYRDRRLRRPGMIRTGDIVVRSFARIGWHWGGDWRTLKDYMHFSLTGR